MTDRITISDLITAKKQNRKIAAISCYDYTTAKLISQTAVQMILVGDSAAQSMLGFDTTTPPWASAPWRFAAPSIPAACGPPWWTGSATATRPPA